MRTGAAVKIALSGLWRNVLRSALTVLGVVIGVGTIIAMVGIGNGARAQVESQVASLGENVLMVYPGSTTGARSGVRLGWGSSASLTVDDAEAIKAEAPGVAAVSPEYYLYTQAAAGSLNWKTKVYGESSEYLDIRQWPIASGEPFTEEDVRGARQVAVVGQTASQQLFAGDSPVGQVVRIDGVPFTILGLLAPKGFSVKGHDQDNVILVPYTSAMKRLMGKSAALYAINLKASDASALSEAQEQVTELLRQRHRILPERDDDFVVRNQQEIAETATETARIMTALLGALASVSLLVGGVGIMNIMLVSVTERTREIGIRMAVGARAHDILRQFLVEALVLSSIGGAIGIALGVGTSRFLSVVAEWPALISPGSIGLAFAFSAAVGVFFGFYPARKASRLDPIEALRYE